MLFNGTRQYNIQIFDNKGQNKSKLQKQRSNVIKSSFLGPYVLFVNLTFFFIITNNNIKVFNVMLSKIQLLTEQKMYYKLYYSIDQQLCNTIQIIDY